MSYHPCLATLLGMKAIHASPGKGLEEAAGILQQVLYMLPDLRMK